MSENYQDNARRRKPSLKCNPYEQICHNIEKFWSGAQSERETGIKVDAVVPLHC